MNNLTIKLLKQYLYIISMYFLMVKIHYLPNHEKYWYFKIFHLDYEKQFEFEVQGLKTQNLIFQIKKVSIWILTNYKLLYILLLGLNIVGKTNIINEFKGYKVNKHKLNIQKGEL